MFKVGGGASLVINGDSTPFTIVEIVNDRRVKVKADHIICIKPASNYGSDDAEYDFIYNSEASMMEFSLRKNGSWVQVGQPATHSFRLVEGRAFRRDPHF